MERNFVYEVDGDREEVKFRGLLITKDKPFRSNVRIPALEEGVKLGLIKCNYMKEELGQKVEEPKVEDPKPDEPVVTPQADEPKADEPKVEEPKSDEPDAGAQGADGKAEPDRDSDESKADVTEADEKVEDPAEKADEDKTE